MINFRYHLVSIVAVFLAIAIGVVIGSTVIDSATVSVLERQQESLDNRIDDVEAENDRLSEELDRYQEREEQLNEQSSVLVADRLTDVPVLTIAPRGVEGDVVDDVRRTLVDAGSSYGGTVWLTDRFLLDDEEERADLAEALGLSPELRATTMRAIALDRLAVGLAGAATTPAQEIPAPTDGVEGVDGGVVPPPAEPAEVAALREAGFLDFDAPEGADGDAGAVIAPGTRFVVVSSEDADVPSPDLAVELVRQLAAPEVGVLAAEPVDYNPPEGDPVSTFVSPLLEDEAVAAVVSTVDNVGELDGRLAVAYAVADLGIPVWGHYGEGPGAQRRLPAPPA